MQPAVIVGANLRHCLRDNTLVNFQHNKICHRRHCTALDWKRDETDAFFRGFTDFISKI